MGLPSSCSCGKPRYKGTRCYECERARGREWRRRRGNLTLTVDAEEVADLIVDMLTDDGISVAELARRTGLEETTIGKILNGKRKRVRVEPTLDRLCNYGDKLLYDFFDPR